MASSWKIRNPPFWQGLGVSLLVHGTVLAALYFALVFQWHQPVVMQLDLSALPSLPAPRRAPKPAPAVRQSESSSPNPLTPSAEATPEPACPPPCPETPGAYIPAALAAQGPRWISGFIQDSDYPRLAQKNGQDGTVILAVYLEASGAVREVRLLKGSYDILNQVAIQKVEAARFSPAYDANNKPIPCKLILPIKFELD